VLDETFTADFDDAIVDFEFAGEFYDEFSSLTYLQQRFLDSDLHRFISRDPVSGEVRLPLSQQPYQYALNNPLAFSDPTGEFSVPSLAELQTALTIAGIISAVGITQVLGSAVFARGTMNFSGALGSFDFNATPTVGVSLGASYLLGGFGSENSFVAEDDENFSLALGTGAGITISAGLSVSAFGPFSASLGNASLDVSRNALTNTLRGSSLSWVIKRSPVNHLSPH